MENTIAKSNTVEKVKLPAFGEAVTDHMFVANFDKGSWEIGDLLPFGNLSLSPMTLALHYGQSVFEGLKAYRTLDGDISIFRLEKHWERLNLSLERFCMPMLPKSIFLEGLETLLHADKDFLPNVEGAALYIRPFVFATDALFGYRVSETYKLIIFCGPVGPYYPKPLKVRVETQFVRAVEGGTGFAKCAGNYGGAIYPTALAKKDGFDQVLWTDHEHKYVEESGTMNVMFVINGTLVTPPLTTTILDGVTRDSVIQLAKYWNIPVEERKISVEEIRQGLESGTLTEAFGVGTAATVAPIATIGMNDTLYEIPQENEFNLGKRIKNALSDIQHGNTDGLFNWTYRI